MMSYHKALINFYHDVPNSPVPGFVFLEFLVNALSPTSHSESAKRSYLYSHTASAENSMFRISFNKRPPASAY